MSEELFASVAVSIVISVIASARLVVRAPPCLVVKSLNCTIRIVMRVVKCGWRYECKSNVMYSNDTVVCER